MRRVNSLGHFLLAVAASWLVAMSAWAEDAPRPQYEHEGIKVVAAHADEPKLPQFSPQLAAAHLDQGALAWSGQRKCISCHTNGTYMQIRPALTAQLGPPSEDVRKFFLAQLDSSEKSSLEELRKSTKPAQLIYLAAGLAEWDAHVTKKLSPETDRALKLMFAIQLDSGTWSLNTDSWHFITYSGTGYPLLALSMCDSLK